MADDYTFVVRSKYLGDAFGQANRDMRTFTAGMRAQSDALASMARRYVTVGAAVATVTKGFKEFASTDRALRNLAVQTGLTVDQVQKMSPYFERLGRVVSEQTRTMVEGMQEFYEASGLGLDEALKAFPQVAMAAKTLGVEVKSAGDMFGAFTRNMKIMPRDYDKIIEQMAYAQRHLRLEMSQLQSELPRATEFLERWNMTGVKGTAEWLALLGAVRPAFRNAGEAAQGLSSTLERLTSMDVARIMGTTGEDWIAQLTQVAKRGDSVIEYVLARFKARQAQFPQMDLISMLFGGGSRGPWRRVLAEIMRAMPSIGGEIQRIMKSSNEATRQWQMRNQGAARSLEDLTTSFKEFIETTGGLAANLGLVKFFNMLTDSMRTVQDLLRTINQGFKATDIISQLRMRKAQLFAEEMVPEAVRSPAQQRIVLAHRADIVRRERKIRADPLLRAEYYGEDANKNLPETLTTQQLQDQIKMMRDAKDFNKVREYQARLKRLQNEEAILAAEAGIPALIDQENAAKQITPEQQSAAAAARAGGDRRASREALRGYGMTTLERLQRFQRGRKNENRIMIENAIKEGEQVRENLQRKRDAERNPLIGPQSAIRQGRVAQASMFPASLPSLGFLAPSDISASAARRVWAQAKPWVTGEKNLGTATGLDQYPWFRNFQKLMQDESVRTAMSLAAHAPQTKVGTVAVAGEMLVEGVDKLDKFFRGGAVTGGALTEFGSVNKDQLLEQRRMDDKLGEIRDILHRAFPASGGEAEGGAEDAGGPGGGGRGRLAYRTGIYRGAYGGGGRGRFGQRAGTYAGGARGGGMTRGDRNNNPGNLKMGAFARRMGATGQDEQGHAVFPNYETGRKALEALVRERMPGHSLRDINSWYAEDQKWAGNVAAAMGVNPDYVIKPGEEGRVADAIMHAEGTHTPEQIARMSKGPAGGEGGVGGDRNYFQRQGAQPLEREQLSTIRTPYGNFQVNPQAAKDFEGALGELHAAGAPIRTMGFYNKRRMRRGKAWSSHAYAAAGDIDNKAALSPEMQAWIARNPEKWNDILKRHQLSQPYPSWDAPHIEWAGPQKTPEEQQQKAGAAPQRAGAAAPWEKPPTPAWPGDQHSALGIPRSLDVDVNLRLNRGNTQFARREFSDMAGAAHRQLAAGAWPDSYSA